VSEVFMGIIAVAVLVIAVVQVAVAILALRATKQLGHLTAKLEQDIRPIVANLQAITAEAARATAIAAVQVERADKLFADLAARVEDTIASVQHTVAGAARGGTWLTGIKAAIAALRDLRAPAPRRPSHAEEEDALFIG
jgi:hypothetical protein